MYYKRNDVEELFFFEKSTECSCTNTTKEHFSGADTLHLILGRPFGRNPKRTPGHVQLTISWFGGCCWTRLLRLLVVLHRATLCLVGSPSCCHSFWILKSRLNLVLGRSVWLFPLLSPSLWVPLTRSRSRRTSGEVGCQYWSLAAGEARDLQKKLFIV